VSFPPFDLVRLLRTVFEIDDAGESYAVLTDLGDPRDVAGFAYLANPGLGPQGHAYRTLYTGLLARRRELRAREVSFYAYRETGGSNLDLPATVFTPEGAELPLVEALRRHTIVLCMGRWSATAPLTAFAREMGFRGATMHGTNDRVLETGLAVDYGQVSADAERMRRALTAADSMRLDWDVAGKAVALDLALGGQEAQKSHGLVRARGDVANLPAGEVYWVPEGAEGLLPRQFEDAAGTIAVFDVRDGGIAGVRDLVRGDGDVVDRYLAVIAEDPNAGRLTELGLGTQRLPWAHTDIQDEKILGTAHVATGRSDHLGGPIGSAQFRNPRNATHDDILYTPAKTPDVALRRVTMRRDGGEFRILEDYRPAAFLRGVVG
jgi:hypothetical protein